MLGASRIAVVVPAYDEACWIEETVRTVPAFVDHVVVVDDGSRDETSTRARALGDRRVEVVRHRRNRGVGAALGTGYRCAFALGADVVAVMAGDGQMHPDDLERLVAPVVAGEVDYAKGDRLSYPGVAAVMPRLRYHGNRVLSALTRVATGLAVRDSQCGYTALARRGAGMLPLDALWHGYGYPNDVLGWIALGGGRVRDVVVRPRYRGEASGIGARHALFVIPWVLARVCVRRAKRALSRFVPRPGGVSASAGAGPECESAS